MKKCVVRLSEYNGTFLPDKTGDEYYVFHFNGKPICKEYPEIIGNIHNIGFYNIIKLKDLMKFALAINNDENNEAIIKFKDDCGTYGFVVIRIKNNAIFSIDTFSSVDDFCYTSHI